MHDLILIGDRVLIEPDQDEQQTKAGLYLPASVAERERVQRGHVRAVGPGYLTPNPEYSDSEPWAPERPAVRYLPLQAEPGDIALFLRKDAIPVRYDDIDYLIVPHGALLALERTTPTDRPATGTSLDDLLG